MSVVREGGKQETNKTQEETALQNKTGNELITHLYKV